MRAEGFCMAGGPLARGKPISIPTEPRPRPDARPPVVVLASIFPERVTAPVVQLPVRPDPDDDPTPSPSAAGVAGPELAPLVRAWAREQGRVIGDRGRLSQSLINDYLKATA